MKWIIYTVGPEVITMICHEYDPDVSSILLYKSHSLNSADVKE